MYLPILILPKFIKSTNSKWCVLKEKNSAKAARAMWENICDVGRYRETEKQNKNTFTMYSFNIEQSL